MRKVIAILNMTLDGVCDHTKGISDDEILDYYTDVLNNNGTLLYGKTTYQLMESYWPTLVTKPGGNRAMDEFALALDRIPKVVFSSSLKNVGWKSTRLAKKDLKEEVLALKLQTGGDILVGSRSLIVECFNLGLIDEFQLCVQPIINGEGLKLFDNIKNRIELKLLKTRTFGCGVMAHYYQTIKK